MCQKRLNLNENVLFIETARYSNCLKKITLLKFFYFFLAFTLMENNPQSSKRERLMPLWDFQSKKPFQSILCKNFILRKKSSKTSFFAKIVDEDLLKHLAKFLTTLCDMLDIKTL